jgi:hypothetical protein
LPNIVHASQPELAISVPLIGRKPEPFHSFLHVAGNAQRVSHPKLDLGSGIACGGLLFERGNIVLSKAISERSNGNYK